MVRLQAQSGKLSLLFLLHLDAYKLLILIRFPYSGKTDVVVFGLEPGAKQLENAKAKGVPTIDRFTLHKILIVEAELPSKDPSQPPTKKTKVKSESYDC